MCKCIYLFNHQECIFHIKPLKTINVKKEENIINFFFLKAKSSTKSKEKN